MIVLGIALLLVALAVVLAVTLAGLPVSDGSRVTLELVGVEAQTSAVVLFLAGAVTLAVLELGLLAVRAGFRTATRRRAESHRLRRVEAEVQARQAAESQRNAADLTGGAPGPGRPPAAPAVPGRPPSPPFTRREQPTGAHVTATTGTPASEAAVDDRAAGTVAADDPAPSDASAPADPAAVDLPPPPSGR